MVHHTRFEAIQPVVVAEPVPTLADHSAEFRRKLPHGFRLGEEIGRGGVGIVYRALDRALDREVAVKILQERHVAFAGAWDRFLNEARVTGQLQHPGIPAVYRVGLWNDEIPYLAMKLIEGRTLGHLIATKEPLDALAVFEAVAQAVGYAHSRGILHRDLKPENVMVGAFGEVQVMDWGLAKRIDAVEVAPLPEPEDQETIEASADVSQVGFVLGTPAYMAPEQARGATTLTQRADVFGLGAILCELLTGHPPFTGLDAESSRLLACRADLAHVESKLDACEDDRGLVELCRDCLAAAPENRPADGAAVAERVAFLRREAERRARLAEIDRAEAEAETRRQRTRRRTLIRWTAALGLTLLVGVTGTTLGLIRARSAQTEAETARDAARRRGDNALEAYNQMVTGIQEKFQNLAGTRTLRLDLLGKARDGLKKLLDDPDRATEVNRILVWCRIRLGDAEANLGNTRGAGEQFRAALELATAMVEADPNGVESRRDLTICYERVGNLQLQTGHSREALEIFEKRLPLCRALVEADPNHPRAARNLSICYQNLGDAAEKLGRHREARDYFRLKDELDRRRVAAVPTDRDARRELAITQDRLGHLARQAGELDAASKAFCAALIARRELIGEDPKNLDYRRDLSISSQNLGGLAFEEGRADRAEGHYREMQATLLTLIADDPSNVVYCGDLNRSRSRLGRVLLYVGRVEEALDQFRLYRESARKLSEDDPNDYQLRREYGIGFENECDAFLKLGKLDEARAACEKRLEIATELERRDPGYLDARRDLALARGRLGDVEEVAGRHGPAVEQYRRAVAIYEELDGDEVGNLDRRCDLSRGYQELGTALLRAGQIADGLEWVSKAADVARRACAADRTGAAAHAIRLDLATAEERIAQANLVRGRLGEARDHYRRVLELRRPFVERSPGDLTAHLSLFDTYLGLGRAERMDSAFGEAAKSFTAARELMTPQAKDRRLTDRQRQAIEGIDAEIARCRAAERVLTDLEYAFTLPGFETAESVGGRVRLLLREKRLVEAMETSERFADRAETRKTGRGAERYNAACLFAQCAAADRNDDRPMARSLDCLKRATEDGFFTTQEVLHFGIDADFDGMRRDPRFVVFAESLKPEVLPMPGER